LWLREGFADYLAGLAQPNPRGTALGTTAARHLRLLREQAWSDWEEFLVAGKSSRVFERPSFYAQSWLAVHWLLARGHNLDGARPADFESLVRAKGRQWMDEQLHEYTEALWEEFAELGAPHEEERSHAAPVAVSPEPRLTETWELPYWQAEFHRELDHREQARQTLESLERDYPGRPEPSESLGALAIAQGQYQLAERKLGAAVSKGSHKPSTDYRYSLMLLRPVESHEPAVLSGSDAERVRLAIFHAKRARHSRPGEARYLLAEAQALMVGGQWDEAARLLMALHSFPDWRGRSELEFAELLRRRQQAMRSIAAPSLMRESGPPSLTAWLSPSLPEAPRPEPPAEPQFTWPPPGTILLYGHINGVECRADEKIVRVRTPRFTIELREQAASPAKLYYPPRKWEALPCGLRGYEVNVVYRPAPAGGDGRGDLVAVVF
jgi:tetratricopeptide (TPR) repeat protein